MARLKELYTTPVICRCENGEWFVFFRFWDTEAKKYKPFKRSEDLNRIKDPKEKEAEFKALRDARELWLKMGWNPLKDPIFASRLTIQPANDLAGIADWPVQKALEFVVQRKAMAPKSRYDYRKSVEYFLQAATSSFFHLLPVGKLERRHIKAIFNHLQVETGLSNKNYNKRLAHIKSLLSELVEWEAIPHNPAFGMKELAEEKTQKFLKPEGEERKLIREYLYMENYRFFVYCMTIYYSGVRPAEIISLRVQDIDLVKGLFHLQPFSNVVKNKKERWIAVHPNLLAFYQKMDLKIFLPEDFIFSTDFKPGPTKIKRRVATDLWHKLVWEELGIHKFMYSLKHLGADDLIAAGVDEKYVVDHLGHSEKFMTRRYTQKGVEQSRQAVMTANIEF